MLLVDETDYRLSRKPMLYGEGFESAILKGREVNEERCWLTFFFGKIWSSQKKKVVDDIYFKSAVF